MNKRKNTVIFVSVVLVIAFAGILAQETLLKEEGGYAVISSGGEEAARLPLSENTELVIGDEEQGYNRIVVEDGAISVTEADCPDKVCVREGKISRTGEFIACLPHELIITIEGGGGETIDAFAR
ncbi:hypothetical protein BRYFOR_05347 [Marvinbryantia formatexigens DSM 14469]|uniref:Uncharacterized protein n=1 Tax=Marvinbryantia formatexigens DSM 14469 TaxID=478749 RepID=C6L9Q7_9FIRM|nr:NusG domain II-containing protein [Marvinbryantia formatexigens]EET62314.1 hypothetical protein BRYFOR_05347 [Marvinbryantia formatexigens DSM 14469]UWO25127.1 NusG domain II-containing protein [Marvinbryantia formatexigens DSM 14469]SDG96471.1 hypothetical protein SAMN05660368_03613 [Marvinbryantia formatexigens]